MAPSRHHSQRAFTIVEILVVVVIIAVLIGILLPSFAAIRTKGFRTVTTATMSAIQTGLTQYYNDFGFFPPSSPLIPGTNTAVYGTSIVAGRGDQMLAECLLGYLPEVNDGADGLGFRTRKTNAAMGGAKTDVKGPFTPSDAKSFNGQAFIDAWGRPILYYRSTRTGAPDPTLPSPAPAVTLVFGTGTGNSNNYYFNQADCSAVSIVTSSFTSNATPNSPVPPAGFYQLIGASSNAVSSAVSGSTNYLLISAGPDEKYFTPDDVIVTK